MRRIAWEGACGYSSRDGGTYPNWWCPGNPLHLFQLLRTYGRIFPLGSDRVFYEGERAGGIRETSGDLAHIIRQRFCYNRRCLTQVNRVEIVRQAGTGLTRQALPAISRRTVHK